MGKASRGGTGKRSGKSSGAAGAGARRGPVAAGSAGSPRGSGARRSGAGVGGRTSASKPAGRGAAKASARGGAKASVKPNPKNARRVAAKTRSPIFDRPTKGEKSAPRRARPSKPKAPLGVAGRDASGAGVKFAVEAARLLSDLKCTDVLVLDVRGKSGVADYLVVGSGTSDRQMRSAGDGVADLGATMDHPAFRSDADARSTWLVLDCVDVVVHLFEPSTREYYDIETLWGDAPRVAWARGPGDVAPALVSRRSATRDESTPAPPAPGEAEAGGDER